MELEFEVTDAIERRIELLTAGIPEGGGCVLCGGSLVVITFRLQIRSRRHKLRIPHFPTGESGPTYPIGSTSLCFECLSDIVEIFEDNSSDWVERWNTTFDKL